MTCRVSVNDKSLRCFTRLLARDRKTFLKNCSVEILKSLVELCVNAKLLQIKVDKKTKISIAPLLSYFNKRTKILNQAKLRKFFCDNNLALSKLVRYALIDLIRQGIDHVLIQK